MRVFIVVWIGKSITDVGYVFEDLEDAKNCIRNLNLNNPLSAQAYILSRDVVPPMKKEEMNDSCECHV